MIPWRLKIVAFLPEHPKWDQNPWFTPLSERTSISDLSRGSPPPPPPLPARPLRRYAIILCKSGRLDQGGGSNFPYILLNEIQTMFSQLAKQSWRHQSADSCTAHEQSLSSRSVNKTRNMAADASAKCGGFFLVYSTILFISKPFNLEHVPGRYCVEWKLNVVGWRGDVCRDVLEPSNPHFIGNRKRSLGE